MGRALPGDRCFVCGGRADSFWQGQSRVAVCWACAREVLPALLADALPHVGPDLQARMNDALRDFDRQFWRATTIKMIREREGRDHAVGY